MIPFTTREGYQYLIEFSGIIKAYLDNNDAVLYCYCDNKEIDRGKSKLNMSPQKYRSLLFSRMFDRIGNVDYVNHTVQISDETYGDHYIHLISKISNSEHIEAIENELVKLHK